MLKHSYSLRALKMSIKQFLQWFKTQYILSHYYEIYEEKLRQNLDLGFQGYIKSLKDWNMIFRSRNQFE